MQLIPRAPENDLSISHIVISAATVACGHFPWTDENVLGKKTDGKFGMEGFSLHRTVCESVGIGVLFVWSFLFSCDGENMESK